MKTRKAPLHRSATHRQILHRREFPANTGNFLLRTRQTGAHAFIPPSLHFPIPPGLCDLVPQSIGL